MFWLIVVDVGVLQQLGLGDTHHRTRPAHVAELSGKCCVAVACGRYHSLALTQDRRLEPEH